MVIKYRKGKPVVPVLVEFDLGLYDSVHLQSITSRYTFKDVLQRCVKNGLQSTIKEITEEQIKELEISKRYRKENNE